MKVPGPLVGAAAGLTLTAGIYGFREAADTEANNYNTPPAYVHHLGQQATRASEVQLAEAESPGTASPDAVFIIFGIAATLTGAGLGALDSEHFREFVRRHPSL